MVSRKTSLPEAVLSNARSGRVVSAGPRWARLGSSVINSRRDGVALFRAEVVAHEADRCKLGLADGRSLRVLALVELA